MKFEILTLFPEMFEGPLSSSILKKAQEKGLLEVNTVNFRDYSMDKHKRVDDYPHGGGAGMVLKPEPIYRAVDHIMEKNLLSEKEKPTILLMTPQGKPFNQAMAKELANKEHLVFICGHYEGFDERIRALAHMEVSIGDFVLTGGELPAMVIVDSVARLLPGVLGESESAITDSFYNGLLEYPQYTRPREFNGMEVPAVLLSGDHEKVRVWRRKESLRRTFLRRPELIEKIELTKEDKKLLEIIKEEEGSQ